MLAILRVIDESQNILGTEMKESRRTSTEEGQIATKL